MHPVGLRLRWRSGIDHERKQAFSMSEAQPDPRDSADEIVRLRREFDEMPKVPGHGTSLGERHGDMRKEWVMSIIADP